ncbi:uncharacterized protein LAJ45_02974 [Morchella importuna]|uniref:uncharacterized protein n=1 Tax=Morchella importuna TaxID=1174673 RepID=UPI001E8CC1DC|nr:uncharacterized protein LAJ45_02974 [Morchella importuna]KAH8152750.1 hypothetical protein LAJ45_02974 [Morchella importuna]
MNTPITTPEQGEREEGEGGNGGSVMVMGVKKKKKNTTAKRLKFDPAIHGIELQNQLLQHKDSFERFITRRMSARTRVSITTATATSNSTPTTFVAKRLRFDLAIHDIELQNQLLQRKDSFEKLITRCMSARNRFTTIITTPTSSSAPTTSLAVRYILKTNPHQAETQPPIPDPQPNETQEQENREGWSPIHYRDPGQRERLRELWQKRRQRSW